jgi:drug/metabolite transporter (DMT)-like permease
MIPAPAVPAKPKDKKPLTRLQADLLLLAVAFIWGTAFVAQKTALDHIGPCTYTSVRFFLSTLLVLPLALRERRKNGAAATLFRHAGRADLVFICLVFSFAVLSQQIGIAQTSIASAGFLTGLYVLFVPVISALLYKVKPSAWIFPAALLSVAGVWLLSGGGGLSNGFGKGEFLELLCAVGFGWQVVLVGRIMAKASQAAFRLSCLQYLAVACISGLGMALFEHPTAESILSAWRPILYAGVLSGGLAYTAQVVAQRFTPASDSAVILSGESVFAALAGVVILDETLSLAAMLGCGLIICAILIVEFAPLLHRRRQRQKTARLQTP